MGVALAVAMALYTTGPSAIELAWLFHMNLLRTPVMPDLWRITEGGTCDHREAF